MNKIDKLDRAVIMHGIEALVAFAFASLVLYLFRDPLTGLLIELFHRESITNSIEGVMVVVLGAALSAASKRLRADPAVTSVPDFVNNGDAK